MRKRLRIVRREGLGLATIMDRELATEYGVGYVHLAVFAIDVDRVYWLDPDSESLPFGWEVFLTELRLLSLVDPASPRDRQMVASVAASVLEGDAPVGAQIVFAVYDAVTRGKLDPELGKLFQTWRRPPDDLTRALADLWGDETANARKLADHCLRAEIQPPLAAPTAEVLEAIRARTD
jgi:hypothetical protein